MRLLVPILLLAVVCGLLLRDVVPAPRRGDRAAALLPPPPVAAAASLPFEVLAGWNEAEPGERGSCALLLSLVDEATGSPVALDSVQLWRLCVPENEHWIVGDQLQTSVHVPVAGKTIESLPPGRYRIYSRNLRHGTDDPPAFDVRGSRSVVTLAVPIRRRHRVFLKVCDETGRALPRAWGFDRAHTSRSTDRGPPWAALFFTVIPQKISTRVGGGPRIGLWCGEVIAGPQGFDLGLRLEDNRASAVTSTHRFTFGDGLGMVNLRLTRDVMCERTYTAVALPEALVLDSIFKPDGGRASGVPDARVGCTAALVVDGQDRPHKVTVQVPGYLELTFDYRPGDPFPARYLKPRPATR